MVDMVRRGASLYIYILSALFFCVVTYKGAHAKSCSAMDLISEERWDSALRCAKAQNNPLLEKMVLWSEYRDRTSSAKTEEILRFVANNSSFPETWLLKSIAENKINSDTDKGFLKKWFHKNLPITDKGIKYYLEINGSKLDKKSFSAWVKKAWIRVEYNSEERKEFLSKYKNNLTHSDHIKKIDHMIWQGYTRIDNDLLRLVNSDFRTLFEARLKILRNQSNINSIVSSVPKKLRSAPGLLYARAAWYKKRGHYGKIARLVLDHHGYVSTLKSDVWFKMRSRTALEMAQKGHYKTAYAMSSVHNYRNSVNYVDGEWFAGKVAWVYQNNAKRALKHFQNIQKKSKYAISRSKSAYWSALMYQKLGNTDKANANFKIAAEYPDTYYGQLAVIKIKKNKDIQDVDEIPEIHQSDRDWIENNDFVRASRIFAKAKHHQISRKFAAVAYRHANTPGKKYLLTQIGHQKKLYALSVLYNKISGRGGLLFAESGYPLVNLKSANQNVEKALILSLIRQESEFDTNALSPAGAMGLMQLMYPTAQDVSRDLGIKINKEKLFNSPALNIKLGSNYISSLLERYDNNYILAVASYNGGPHNVDKWIKAYGDPRGMSDLDDVVEWVEKIPFYETRAYVQHVLSNVQIYRNILKNRAQKTKIKQVKISLSDDLVKKS